MSGRTFRIDLDAWEKLTHEQVDGFARQIAQETGFRVVVDTPVDTGFLRASWQPSIGAPEVATDADAIKEPKGSEGAMTMAKVGLKILDVKAGDDFYMTNNANYALYVHDGTASMAGRPWVTRVVASWQNIVNAVARDLGLGL